MNLTFLCDKQVTWPSTVIGGDVPNGADTYSFIYDFSEKICKYSMTFKYNGACFSAPTIGPTLCHISKYDYKMLAEHEYWEFNGDRTACKASDSCSIYFRICEDLPTSLTSNCGANSGVCILSQGTYYNLGIYNNSYDDLVERPDEQGFTAEYKGGDGIFLGCTGGAKLTTTLNFRCGLNSKWPKDNASHDALSPYKVDYDADKCTAVFHFNYNGACFNSEPIIIFDAPILFVFVIFLFVIFAIYWIAGIIINLLLGKRGSEIIPNKSFWIELIKLFGGGFMLIFNVISCKSASKQVGKMEEEEEPIVTKGGYQTIDNEKNPFGP
ncbi:hypothetical protein LOD99_2940 [Oopsacas minuta]|uniref:Autophagy-related protein 27 n=1 Tax=Oopsacas minuta TaxID=111878 RepID=A0AAV7K0I4_9METZ|nr:hypothetical protein LOD99_2940 [Oopsacas minuta]